ncbi:predicted protein [Plenodomus lingam JN3]|uniref:Predicted protein n=1 Tax=Leptosphaeria maculans (strain JN3 / isolate v23.1.3 / race Av1-4-5-6-7-8) TaxID=985895 RepID=E4ZHR4_LEPMJ|nr:predicted protein [Plenodomus lingam JN3]CBX90897.1 predicted protein [Plenodomus lingam JN3]
MERDSSQNRIQKYPVLVHSCNTNATQAISQYKL